MILTQINLTLRKYFISYFIPTLNKTVFNITFFFLTLLTMWLYSNVVVVSLGQWVEINAETECLKFKLTDNHP